MSGGEKKNNGNGGEEKKNDGGEKKNDGNGGGEKKNNGNGGGEKKNDGGEKKNDGNGGGEKKNDGGEKKNDGNGGGEKKNDGNGGGEKKNNGGEKKNDGNGGGEKKNDGNGGGWMSTFFKVAGAAAATAVVAGGLYIAMKQPKAEQVAFGSSSNEKQPEEEEEVEEEEEISWTKPGIGWVKLNVDGSLLPHSAGCGGVLRDPSGKWISGFAQKLDPTLRVDQIEKEAILIGLKWADKRLGLGVRKLAVESDNEGVVYMVNRRGPSNDPLICDDIRKLLFDGRYEQATLTSIPRKANQVADRLANMSHDSSSFNLIEYVSPPPKNCLRALSIDGGYY